MQEYKLMSLEKSDFQDQHGNYWCTAAFEGVSEPVRWVLKDPMKVREGETYYGEIKDATSKAGKPYLRFYKQQNPGGNGTGGATGSTGGWKDNSDGQRQGMCFNNATLFVNLMFEMSGEKPSPEDWANTVYTHAQALYLKGDLASKVMEAPKQTSLSEQYKSVKAANADEVYPIGDEPINLNDIPF